VQDPVDHPAWIFDADDFHFQAESVTECTGQVGIEAGWEDSGLFDPGTATVVYSDFEGPWVQETELVRGAGLFSVRRGVL
jgi:hypothetical protein